MESFPEEKLLPKNITTLRISKLKNLRKLDDKGFQQLKAHRTLKINSFSDPCQTRENKKKN